MKITYDPAKREATLRERGIDFADAEIVFAGRYSTPSTIARTMAKPASRRSGF